MTRFFLRHPVTTWMIFTGFVVLGLYAVPRLKIEAIPEVELPTLTVRTVWAGAAPEAVQRSISLPVEEAARKVHGVEELRSTSRAGRSVVTVSFRRDVDVEFARLELNEQLGSVRRNLPVGATQPEILPYVPEEFQTEDFFLFRLESHLSPNELRDLSETWIIPPLLAIEGVADALVIGGALPLLKIMLDRTKLQLYDITADDVFMALGQLDELQGAGVVRVDGEERILALRDPVDLERLAASEVARRGDRVYTLSMLGTVQPDFEDPTYLVRSNGRNVIQVRVEKRSGANSVTVSRNLREALPDIETAVPFDVRLETDRDEGKDLEDKLVELVYRSLVILAVLFLVLVISLRQVRLTTIVMGSIVFAIVISLSLFYFFRLSVNFITISGLTVCFGLILDNSILVLDAIHRRLKALERADQAGLSHVAKLKVAMLTIVSGTGEVMFPILATTLTTIVAFLSFIFLSGRLALYYVPLAVAVATAMGASIFVAFIWIPVVLNQGWARGVVKRSADGPRDITDPEELDTFVEDPPATAEKPSFLERSISLVQRLWWIFLPATTALLVWTYQVYDDKVIKGGFWRVPDPQELIMYMEMPAGTDIEVVSETMLGFEEALTPVPEGAQMRVQVFGNQCFTRIEFDEELLKTEVPMHYRLLLVEKADQTAGASIFIAGFSDQPYFKGPFRGSALNSLVEVTGYNSKRLNEISDTVLRSIQRNRRVRNARVTTGGRFERAFLEETVINLDRGALADHGLTVAQFAGLLRRLLGVDTPWRMLIEGEQEQVQIAYQDSETIEYSDVASALITTPGGEQVRVGELATIATQPLSGAITRFNQRYQVNINWEYVGTDRMRRSYIQKVLDGMDLPYGYEAKEGKREFFTQEEEEELTLTLVLALIFIYMVLAALFESFTLPILVLMSIPIALVGVVLLFWKTNTSFDSSAQIGLVLLFGIVVNNAILLISRFRTESSLILKDRLGLDTADAPGLLPGTHKQYGGVDLRVLPRKERAGLLRRAVSRGTRIRMRSILLTSGTTIVGLAPLVLPLHKVLPFIPSPAQESQGTDIWDNLALSSIGGLISSTILLILCMPPLYYFCVRFWWTVEGWIWQAIRWIASIVTAVTFGFGAVMILWPTLPWVETVLTRTAEKPLLYFTQLPASAAFGIQEQVSTLSATWPGVVAAVIMMAGALLLLVPRLSAYGAGLLALLLTVNLAAGIMQMIWPDPASALTLLVLLVLLYTAPRRPRAPVEALAPSSAS